MVCKLKQLLEKEEKLSLGSLGDPYRQQICLLIPSIPLFEKEKENRKPRRKLKN